MSTTYNNSIKIHNEKNTTLTGVWLAYRSGSVSTRYFDCTNVKVDHEGHLHLGNITSAKGESDYWSLAIIDDRGYLWASKHEVNENIPHADGEIEITINSDNKVTLKMPEQKSKSFDIKRF